MTYASIISAEYGWQALFVRRDGTPSIVDIDKWGIPFNDPTKLAPLNRMNDDLSRRNGFVYIIDPNNRPSDTDIVLACKSKIDEVGYAMNLEASIAKAKRP